MYLLALLVLPFDAKSSDMSPRSASGAESARSKLKEFDKLGSVLFMTFIGLLLACVNRGNELGWPFYTPPRFHFFKNASCQIPSLRTPACYLPKNWHIYKVNQLATK